MIITSATTELDVIDFAMQYNNLNSVTFLEQRLILYNKKRMKQRGIITNVIKVD